MAPPHALYGSLDELLSPEVLSTLEGRTVAAVRRRPFTSPYGGVSGNAFLAVETAGTNGEPRSYIAKQTAPAWDVIMRISGDAACREMLVWQHRLLDRLPPEVGHTIVAAAEERGGWALLMHDIGDRMHPCQRWPERRSTSGTGRTRRCSIPGSASASYPGCTPRSRRPRSSARPRARIP
jgi:hypothetical protein